MQGNPNLSTNQAAAGGLGGGSEAGMGNTTGLGMGQGAGAGTGTAGTGAGNGDMLDKGVDYAERRAGHEQSHSTTEKISDAVRTGFSKVTGKNVPVKDKQYS